MRRPVAMLGLAAVLVAFAGCRHACGDRCGSGPFSRGSAGRAACPDPVLGVPVSNPGGPAGMLIPSGGGSTEDLPPPGGYLPPPNVPLAPPKAAPPPTSDGLGTLPAPKFGVPVGKGN